MEDVRPVIASNGVSCLQMRLVGSHSTSERKRRKGWANDSDIGLLDKETYSSKNKTFQHYLPLNSYIRTVA